jgi:energy-coupling factor transporter transmembrane protein EcfT
MLLPWIWVFSVLVALVISSQDRGRTIVLAVDMRIYQEPVQYRPLTLDLPIGMRPLLCVNPTITSTSRPISISSTIESNSNLPPISASSY